MNRRGQVNVLTIRWLVIALLAFWPGHALADDWEVVRGLPGSGARWAATSANGDGHRLYIWSVEAPGYREAYVGFHLAGDLRFAGAMPTYQIDDGEILDTGIIRKLGEKHKKRWTFLEGNRSRWRIWVSRDKVVRAKHVFRKWLIGQRVRIRYTDSSGKQRKTVFSLKNSADAILRATRVQLE